MKEITLLLLSVILPLVNGFQKGAPPNSCATTIPNHSKAKHQLIPSWYRISVTNLDTPDGLIRVRLYSKSSSDYFTGFLLWANMTSTNVGHKSCGVFEILNNDSSILDCGTQQPPAVTHTNKQQKLSVEVNWRPPTDYSGEVVFSATVVRSYSVFWKGIDSPPIKVIRQFNSEENNKPLNLTLQTIYDGCGSSKNCLVYPEGCLDTKMCSGFVSIVNINGKYLLEMFAKKAKYVAVGFSVDAPTGKENIVECVHENQEVKAYRSWNDSVHNERLKDNVGINQLRGAYSNNTVYCKLKIDAKTNLFNEIIDLDKDRYYLSLTARNELSAQESGTGYHNVFSVVSKGRYFFPVVSNPAEESLYDGCGDYKICHGVPDDCVVYRNCRFVTMVRPNGRKFIIFMSLKNAAYMATAFTDDQRRGNDNIVECVNNGSSLQTYRSWNVPYSFDNYRMGTTGVELLNGTITKNGLICTVSFDPSVIPSFQLSQKYYLLIVAGDGLGYQQVGYHNILKKFNNETVTLLEHQADRNNFFYTGCGESRLCFGHPNGCTDTENCDVAVSVASDNVGNRYSFHIIAHNAPAYVAVGLSEDNLMGNDAVIECVREETSVKTYMSWNIPGTKTNERVNQSAATHLHGSFIDGMLECIVMFQNPLFELKGKQFDLTKDKYVLMLAAGTTVAPFGNLGYHDLLKIVASKAETLSQTTTVQESSKFLIYLHGSLMIIAWIGLTSFGIVIARYYKTSLNSSGIRNWFFWHKYSMFLASVLTVVGVIAIYIYCGQWITEGPSADHALMGVITALLTVFQAILATLRPNPSSVQRIFFNRLHSLVGNGTHTLAIVTIFSSINLIKAQLPLWTRWVLAGYVIHYILMHLLLMLTHDMDKYAKKTILQTDKLQNEIINELMPSLKNKVNKKYSLFREHLLKFHLWITSAFTGYLIYLFVSTMNE